MTTLTPRASAIRRMVLAGSAAVIFSDLKVPPMLPRFVEVPRSDASAASGRAQE